MISHEQLLHEQKRTNELLEEMVLLLKGARTISDYCSKEEALKILGWDNTKKAGSEKLMLLRREGRLSRPLSAPMMYITAEVYEVKALNLQFTSSKGVYRLIKA